MDSEQALEMCRSLGERWAGEGAEVAAAFDTTAGGYAAAAAGKSPINPPSGLTDFAQKKLAEGPETPLYICYWDQDEKFFTRTDPPYRVRALVDTDGGAYSELNGSPSSLDLVRPEHDEFWGVISTE